MLLVVYKIQYRSFELSRLYNKITSGSIRQFKIYSFRYIYDEESEIFYRKKTTNKQKLKAVHRVDFRYF